MQISPFLFHSGITWNHLQKEDIHIIEENLAILVKPEKDDSDLSRFYDKLLYTLMLKRLETPDQEEFMKRYRVPVTKVARISRNLLKKTSIPGVKQQQDVISLPLGPEFWKADGVAHLEGIRAGIRELIKYIDPEDQK